MWCARGLLPLRQLLLFDVERRKESPHRLESHHSVKQEQLSFHSNPMPLSRAFSQTLTESTGCSWVRDAVNWNFLALHLLRLAQSRGFRRTQSGHLRNRVRPHCLPSSVAWSSIMTQDSFPKIENWTLEVGTTFLRAPWNVLRGRREGKSIPVMRKENWGGGTRVSQLFNYWQVSFLYPAT